MTIKTSYVAIGATILVAIGVASCDSRERTAVQPSTGPSPVTPVPSLVRVELIAPGSIAPGESVQLTANAVKSDNSVENVTALAQWTSSDPAVLEISSTGVAKAMARGEAVGRGAGRGLHRLPLAGRCCSVESRTDGQGRRPLTQNRNQ